MLEVLLVLNWKKCFLNILSAAQKIPVRFRLQYFVRIKTQQEIR